MAVIETQTPKKKRTRSDIIMAVVIIAIILGGAAIVIADKMPEKGSSYERMKYSDYVKLGDYEGLKVDQDKVDVTEEEIKDEIKTRVDEAATTKSVTKGKVKKGDTVKIDYEGTMNGEKFTGGSAEDQSLEIGSGSMIDGFESGLIGKKVGSTVTLDLTFPKDYSNASLAGKDAQFKVRINSIEEPVTYKYNKAFLKKFADNMSKKEYEASVKKDLEKEEKDAAVAAAKADLWTQVTDASEMKEYPKPLYLQEKENYIENAKASAQNYGMEWNAYLEATGMTEETFNDQAKEEAKTMVKEGVIAYAIAKEEDIDMDDEGAAAWLKKELKENDYPVKDFEAAQGMSVEEYCQANNIKKDALIDEVQQFIYDKAKITEVEPTADAEADVIN